MWNGSFSPIGGFPLISNIPSMYTVDCNCGSCVSPLKRFPSSSIPDGASNLEGISDADRSALFEQEFSRALSDPALDAAVRKYAPEGTNIDKAKAGLILNEYAKGGRHIDPRFQPLLDRFRGLEDPGFVSDELKTWVMQNTGIPLEMHDDIPGAITEARESKAAFEERQAYREAGARTRGQTEEQYRQEIAKPISAEDRAKHGIGTKFSTYQEVADEGYRFPTESDRKDYADIADLLYIFDNVLEPLVTKVFTSKDDIMSRARHGIKIRKGIVMGNDLGLTAKEYDRMLPIVSKKMLSMVERGGRFTDQDYQKILEALADINIVIPDGKEMAMRLLENARSLLGHKLEFFKSVMIKPMGQPTSEIDAEVQALITEFGGK